VSAVIRPRSIQLDALTALPRAFAVSDRAQLRMACGTGKTLVGRWHAEASDARTVLVLLPSLSLVGQTLREWRRIRTWPFDALVVCSDPTTAAGEAERVSDEPEADPDWDAVRARVTTDHRKVMAFLRRGPVRAKVVFSTYHSLPVVAQAQRGCGIEFDLAVCDEAHRLTGRPRPEFRLILGRQIDVARRLFMTATAGGVESGEDAARYTMADEAMFGPVAHEVSFARAIATGLLCDYQVLVIADEQSDDGHLLPAAALRKAATARGLTRVLTYHGRVAKAQAFAEQIDGLPLDDGRTVRARWVSGALPASTRAEILRWLAAGDPGELRVVTSARCLSEGVDVPAVDGIMFTDNRESTVDIVQSVGRVLRTAPGKTEGTIILPVAVPIGVDDDTALATGCFGAVWAVLRGLRAHDERLADALERAAVEYGKTGQVRARPTDRVVFDLPPGVRLPDVELRLVHEVGTGWQRMYGLLLDYAESTGGARLAWNLTWRGVGLGAWAEDQRLLRRHGRLPARRVRLLDEVPGWAWDRADAWWNDSADLVEQAAREHGVLFTDTSSVLDGQRSADRRYRLGVWLAHQRQAYRDGLLDADRVARLRRIPGFTWTPVPAEDLAMVDALRVFIDFEHHADVPEDHVEDGLPLGRWVLAVRRRKLVGRLHPALHDELMAAAGFRGRMRMWQWNVAETTWRLHYSALRQYAAREGHAAPPGTYRREQLPDATVNLGNWVAQQRLLYHRRQLDPQHAAWLAALPGWVWTAPGVTRAADEPIDLGDHPHGTAKGYAVGCRCEDCLTYNRESGRRSMAAHKRLRNPVPPDGARRHLEALAGIIRRRIAGDRHFERPPGPSAYAVAADVPVGVVRGLVNGRLAEIEDEHARRIRATTADDVLALYDTEGSRGRLVMSCELPVDAGPTTRLLRDLETRGWNQRWIARELGYAQLAVKIDVNGTITTRVADQIAALHARVGRRVAPGVGRRNVRLPRLDDILAAERSAA
jgi:superfamily II DNA or RNA helicase